MVSRIGLILAGLSHGTVLKLPDVEVAGVDFLPEEAEIETKYRLI